MAATRSAGAAVGPVSSRARSCSRVAPAPSRGRPRSASATTPLPASVCRRASACSGEVVSVGNSPRSSALTRTADWATSSPKPSRRSSRLDMDPSSTALACAPRSSASAVRSGVVRRRPRSRSRASMPSLVAANADPTPSRAASRASGSGAPAPPLGGATAAPPPSGAAGGAGGSGAPAVRVCGGTSRRLQASGSRPLRAYVGHRGHRLPELGQPFVLMLGYQPHTPGQRLRTRPCHTGVDERVEHLPLRLTQPGHDRSRHVREQLGPVTDRDLPRDLAVEPALCLGCDRHPLAAGVLAERLRAAGTSFRCLGRTGGLGELHIREGQRDGDLLTVHDHGNRRGLPLLGNPAGEPATYPFLILCCNHVIHITPLASRLQEALIASPRDE